MKEEYPCFSDKKIREEYSDKINNLFEKNNFNWVALPALHSSNVFVKPEIPRNTFILNTEALPFRDIVKISIHTKEGIARLGIMAYPPINDCNSKKALEEK